MNAELAQKIVDGAVAFTVDQQPWLQGYSAVDAIWQNKRGGFKIGGGQPVLTGPTIIDKADAARRPEVRPAGYPLAARWPGRRRRRAGQQGAFNDHDPDHYQTGGDR